MQSRTRIPLSEAEVVVRLKRALLRQGIDGKQARQVIVDADAAYLRSRFASQLKPTGTVWIDGWRPDLVCVLGDGHAERLAAFEVKGTSDYARGVIQANRYRIGAHEAYLCVPEVSARDLAWLKDSAKDNGVGLIRALVDTLSIEVPPAIVRPDPRLVLETQRYLLGESSVQAFGLNKPLHYAAALVACMTTSDPVATLETVWGLGASAARMALKGAATLGLLREMRPTLYGRIMVDLLREAGFSLTASRTLTRKRLVDQHPHLAAVLRSVLPRSPAVELVMRCLVELRGGPVIFYELGQHALRVDEGMARAVFGVPQGDAWIMKPTTRFQLKAALYDVGLIDSPLGPGASGPQGPTGYNPHADPWESSYAREVAVQFLNF